MRERILLRMGNHEKLIKWRESSGLSQKAAADLIGVKQATMSRLESGDSLPGIVTSFAIERVTQGEVPASGWVESPHAA